jgi:hypothetical protein
MLELNRSRNLKMADGLELAARALNAEGIEPLLLKGAAEMVDGLYPDPGIRVLGDLDILVPEHDVRRACETLTHAGFPVDPMAPKPPPGHHHLPMRAHARLGVGIELHRQVADRAARKIVPTSGYREQARELPFRGTRVLIANPTERLAHMIAHAQISDRRHRIGVPQLRQMLDVALFSRRHNAAIAWGSLETRFARAGARAVLQDCLAAAEILFGHPVPAPITADIGAAGAQMERALGRSRREERLLTYRHLVRDVPAALASTPLRWIYALNPTDWKSRFSARLRRW